MGYTFKIGNAKPVFSKDYGELRAAWEVEPATSDSAPTFPNDETTGNGNSRSPSYSVWADFCRQVGIYDLFYDDRGSLRAGHPGCAMITADDLSVVKEARQYYEAKVTLPPRFEGWDYEGPQRYDYHLARILWLEWWMDWALKNCETPAIENY